MGKPVEQLCSMPAAMTMCLQESGLRFLLQPAAFDKK